MTDTKEAPAGSTFTSRGSTLLRRQKDRDLVITTALLCGAELLPSYRLAVKPWTVPFIGAYWTRYEAAQAFLDHHNIKVEFDP